MNKRKVVIYGNCHTEAIISLLSQVNVFTDEYEIIPVLPIQNIKDPQYLQESCFRECDLFIHQSIWKKNRYGECYASESIIKNLKEGCRVISIPNVYHLPLCFFPNYSEDKEFVSRKGNTCFFRDRIIDSLSKEGLSSDEIYQKYIDVNLFDSEGVKEQFSRFIKKVEMRELQWDIKVSAFIKDNYKEHRLFHDPNHPTNYFFAYVVFELLKILGIEYDFSRLVSLKTRELDSFEMPICKSVKYILGMTYEDKEMRVTGIKMKKGIMNLYEYIDQYRMMEWQNMDLNILSRIKSFIKWSVYRVGNRLLLESKLMRTDG